MTATMPKLERIVCCECGRKVLRKPALTLPKGWAPAGHDTAKQQDRYRCGGCRGKRAEKYRLHRSRSALVQPLQEDA
jgi:hypothetical protein